MPPGGHGRPYAPALRHNDIVKMFHDVKTGCHHGRRARRTSCRKSTPGSKRTDDLDFIKMFGEAGYTVATTKTEMQGRCRCRPRKLLGLFNTGNIDGAFDLRLARRAPSRASLTSRTSSKQTRAAIDMLKGNPTASS